VRGLAATLNVSKPAITRALDRLGRLGFTKRKRDAEDRRNVLVQRTVKGSVFLHEFGQMVIDAGAVQGALDGARAAAARPAPSSLGAPSAPPSPGPGPSASEPVSAPV
jgi:hypothetical protein